MKLFNSIITRLTTDLTSLHSEEERPQSAQSSSSVPAISLLGRARARADTLSHTARERSRSEHGQSSRSKVRSAERSPAAEIGER